MASSLDLKKKDLDKFVSSVADGGFQVEAISSFSSSEDTAEIFARAKLEPSLGLMLSVKTDKSVRYRMVSVSRDANGLTTIELEEV